MNASFYRKVVYGSIIALLWLPLYYIGRPGERVVTSDGTEAEGLVEIKGGKLVELRQANDLSQADLGEIDPTSESMKLATLGMRGVAINVLWTMANHYKKVEDFDNFAATVNQITLLAPNFVSVWEFQAHNESYNVSVEYDHYRMRYAWVKKGADLLIRGTQYNRKDTRLLNYLSWFFGHKIGRSDEHKQFRELFRNDVDYHAKLNKFMRMDDPEIMGPATAGQASSTQAAAEGKKKPDNWLVGRQWQLRAVDLVESGGVPIRGKSPVLFYSDAPMMRINFCKAIEEEGTLGTVAGTAWETAGKDWNRYGQLPVPTSWGHDIQLGDMEKYQERLKELGEELDKAAPGVREKIYAEKKAKLRPEEREAIDTPIEKRTNEQLSLSYEAESKLQVTATEVADQSPLDSRRLAKTLAREFEETDTLIDRIDRYRGIVNFAYWRSRCALEQSPEALAGRQLIYDAEKKFTEAELEASKELYEKAWQEWAKVYAKHPDMMNDNEAEDLVEAIQQYKQVLGQLDVKQLPDDFPLYPLLEAQQSSGSITSKQAARTMIAKPAQTEEPKKDEPKKNEEPKPEEKKAEEPQPGEEKKSEEPKP
ncbi:MAG TPA: hypothetical protein VL096_02755, partial [Pirellulaceae bacterium]|nr:hypothetical protein [Pirellulaceae bacterium]